MTTAKSRTYPLAEAKEVGETLITLGGWCGAMTR